MTASSRNSVFYQQFLQQVEDANPTGQIWIITDNLSSHNSLSTRTWLEGHPRIHHAFIQSEPAEANPPRRLVAHLPQGRPRRPILRQPQRHRVRHHPRDQPTQLPRKADGSGAGQHPNPTTAAPICVQSLRNPALVGLR